jgi:hypothetical protein
MKITTEIVINKPVLDVWEIVGNQFGSAHIWASALTHTEGSGRKMAEQVCENRTCDVKGMGRISERLLEFDSKNFALTYEVMNGFPFFVERGINRWTMTEEGSSTRLQSVGEITTQGFIGMLMVPLMKMQMTGLMHRMLEDLKHYVEIGVPHPRKAMALASRKPIRA